MYGEARCLTKTGHSQTNSRCALNAENAYGKSRLSCTSSLDRPSIYLDPTSTETVVVVPFTLRVLLGFCAILTTLRILTEDRERRHRKVAWIDDLFTSEFFHLFLYLLIDVLSGWSIAESFVLETDAFLVTWVVKIWYVCLLLAVVCFYVWCNGWIQKLYDMCFVISRVVCFLVLSRVQV